MKEERGPHLRTETRASYRSYRFPIFVHVNRREPAGVFCTCSSDPESTFAFTLRRRRRRRRDASGCLGLA
jgi:hypothetical protein